MLLVVCVIIKPQNYVKDVNGFTYKKISSGIKTQDGDRTDIWQRISPLDTNNYYTPTVIWLVNNNTTHSFAKLIK